MTLRLKPGRNLSDQELARLEALLQQEYPDEDMLLVVDDRPAEKPGPAATKANVFQKLAVLAVTVLAGLYLANPTAGVLELIPDITPVIGNLDEATATALLMSGLGYFGVNVGWLTSIFGGLRKRK